ncbi:class I adenylate-forming enzyme family protein [Sphaerisporangium aureirubrum]|uniref:class I adenylate-forming enzyme family protein n=1 Tax=Sphaerisporangium aureirubrum TaxID=1544736 RepID=UPI003628BB52
MDIFPEPVLRVLREAPAQVVFVQGERTVSAGELLALAGRVMEGLREGGIGAGSGVAVVTGLSAEAYAVHLAVHALGCRVGAFRPGWSPRQTGYGLGFGVEAIVVDGGDVSVRVGPGVPEVAADPGVPVFSLGPRVGAVDLLAGAGGGELVARGDPEAVARLTFTSGSTGMPKACAQTYRAFTMAYRVERWPEPLVALMAAFDRCLIHQSLASPVMMTYLGRCLIAGGTVVFPADGDPEPLLPYALERHAITAVMMPPPRLHRMLALLRERPADLSALRALLLGGSPAGPGLLAEAMRTLGPIVWQGYGQAETGVISMLTPQHLAAEDDAFTSVGRPLPAVEVSVRRDGAEVEPGEVGEIWVRSPHMMTGYWDEPERTAEVLRDGWLHTRDLGRLGPTGLLHLTGRSRDVIMVNAEVCHAGAVELVLAGHPSVSEVYVVGAPDEETGEAFHAFVVPAPAQVIDRPSLLTLVRASLSLAHLPRSITILDRIPLTIAGKPDKSAMTLLIGSPTAADQQGPKT